MIETFKCILSRVKQKAIHCNGNNTNANANVNDSDNYGVMFQKVIETSSVLVATNDIYFKFATKLKTHPTELAKHCNSNFSENIIINIFMDMTKDYFIPMLTICCSYNAVKIGEYSLSNYEVNKSYVQNWRVPSLTFLQRLKPFVAASMIGIACEYKFIEMIELLVRNGANPNIMGDINLPNHWQSKNFLSRAIETCDMKMVELALKPEFQTTIDMINTIDIQSDTTPLMRAVHDNCVDITRMLIKAGADINIQNTLVCCIT